MVILRLSEISFRIVDTSFALNYSIRSWFLVKRNGHCLDTRVTKLKYTSVVYYEYNNANSSFHESDCKNIT